jgi:hypothetical protein
MMSTVLPTPAEQADFAAAQEGLDEVNNLDARLEHLKLG